MQHFTEAADVLETGGHNLKSIMRQFWSVKQMCIAAKVDRTIQLTNEHINNGCSVVIALQTTGESQMNKKLNDDYNGSDFVSTSE